MKSNRHALFALAVLVFSMRAATAAEPEQEIRDTFQEYRTALLDGDGDAAWGVVDSQTHTLYAQVLRDALMLPEKELADRSFIDKLMLLRLRLEFSKPELMEMNGQAVFRVGVKNGWIDKSSVRRMRALHRITVDGKSAAAYLPQAPNVAVFHFARDEGEWKLALTKSFALAESAMQKLRKQQNLSEREFLVQLLKFVAEGELDERIFQGPLE